MNADIQLFFPERCKGISNAELLDEILTKVQETSQQGYAGFPSKKDLRAHLDGFLGNTPELYEPVSQEEQKNIEETIKSALDECQKHLTYPGVSVFVFPWITDMEEMAESLGGVSGVVPSDGIVHLYVIPRKFDYKHLKKAASHEFNHIVFYNNHGFPDEAGPIYKALIFDGLAENFEEFMDGKTPVAAQGTSKDEAAQILSKIYPHLETPISFEEDSFYRKLFFGSEEYKPWTGYTIGYEIVKSFIEDNPDLSWEDIMETEPSTILENSPFAQEAKQQT